MWELEYGGGAAKPWLLGDPQHLVPASAWTWKPEVTSEWADVYRMPLLGCGNADPSPGSLVVGTSVPRSCLVWTERPENLGAGSAPAVQQPRDRAWLSDRIHLLGHLSGSRGAVCRPACAHWEMSAAGGIRGLIPGISGQECQ